jgi:acyl-CoA synthetase (AMP-forming)/AMP-acid ligase II
MIIIDTLAQNARLYRDEIALVERTPSLNTRRAVTWEEFYRTSNQLANALDKAGVHKGDRVVQLMTNCLEWLPIYFGILSVGAWVVPLNFRFESDKIRLCTRTAEAKAFIFGEEFIERIETIRTELETSVQLWIFTGPESLCPDWAVHYPIFIESAGTDEPPQVQLGIEDDAAL